MSSMLRRFALATLVLVLTRPGALPAQAPNPEELLRRARQALQANETERGVELLRQALATQAAGASPLRVETELELATASWALGRYDSATVHFQEAIRLDPTARLGAEEHSAELVRAFEVARRTTAAVGLRLPSDTTLFAVRDSLAVTVTLTQPGNVRLRLTGPGSEGRDVSLRSDRLDSTTVLRIALRDSASRPLPPGRYRLAAEYSAAGVPLPLVQTQQLDVTQQGADTLDWEPAPADSLLRPEYRKGAGPRASIWRGLAFGVAAAVIPVMIGSSALSDGADGQAVAVGVAIGAAGVAGYYLGRPRITIDENVVFNQTIRSAWESRNRAIAQENVARRQQTLLRVRLAPGL